ncbi:transposase [Streptomyces sp. CA-106131]|uniref:transposase n=1 Tax=Streptomyces sp. CA-106131 TaxID=3240045 RepID=UPI003D91E647
MDQAARGADRRADRENVLTGPNPTDCGKLGSKVNLITDRNGLPLSLGISSANLHDSQGLEPLVRGIPPMRSRHGLSRRRPAKLRADKGTTTTTCADGSANAASATASPAKGSSPHSDSASTDGLLRAVSWLAGCRRLQRRNERKAEHFLASVGIAAALIYSRPARPCGRAGPLSVRLQHCWPRQARA